MAPYGVIMSSSIELGLSKQQYFLVTAMLWKTKLQYALWGEFLYRIWFHDYVIKWKQFPYYWLFVRGIHRSPNKGQWHGTLMFSLICAWKKSWVNDRDAGDLRHHRSHYDVTVIHWGLVNGDPTATCVRKMGLNPYIFVSLNVLLLTHVMVCSRFGARLSSEPKLTNYSLLWMC